MSASGFTGFSAMGRKKAINRIILALVAVAAAFAIAMAIGVVATHSYTSFSSPSNQPQQVQTTTIASTGNTLTKDAGTNIATANGAEAIEDDATPMSSGLGGSEPVSSDGIGFAGVALAGIVAVGAFFCLLMRRLNGSIKDMSRMFK